MYFNDLEGDLQSLLKPMITIDEERLKQYNYSSSLRSRYDSNNTNLFIREKKSVNESHRYFLISAISVRGILQCVYILSIDLYFDFGDNNY